MLKIDIKSVARFNEQALEMLYKEIGVQIIEEENNLFYSVAVPEGWTNIIYFFLILDTLLRFPFLTSDNVKLKQELIDRIYKYFKEINADPIVHNLNIELKSYNLISKYIVP